MGHKSSPETCGNRFWLVLGDDATRLRLKLTAIVLGVTMYAASADKAVVLRPFRTRGFERRHDDDTVTVHTGLDTLLLGHHYSFRCVFRFIPRNCKA